MNLLADAIRAFDVARACLIVLRREDKATGEQSTFWLSNVSLRPYDGALGPPRQDFGQ